MAKMITAPMQQGRILIIYIIIPFEICFSASVLVKKIMMETSKVISTKRGATRICRYLSTFKSPVGTTTFIRRIER